MFKDSKVSIIITTYNQAPYLGEAIASALVQSHRNLEIVVIDDGSTDGSEEVAARFSGIKYIKQKNQGVAAARNTGVRACSGEFIVLLDGDDRLLPDAVEIGLKQFGSHPEAMIVAGLARMINKNGEVFEVRTRKSLDGTPYEYLLKGNSIFMPAMAMYRRGVFDLVGLFDGRYAPAEDWEMYLRIARSYPVVFHDHIVAEYRIHGMNSSRKTALLFVQAHKVMVDQWKYVRQDETLRKAYKAGYDRLHKLYGEELVNDIRRALRNKHWRQIGKDLPTLIRLYPHGFIRHVFRKCRCILLGVERSDDDLKSFYDSV